MPRPVTLFTGQWADLPLAELAPLAKSMGYDGLELACWGDHFNVQEALSSPQYVKDKNALLAQHGLQCFAIGNHLVGQAVCDLIDERHQSILPPHVWGDGEPEGVRQRAAAELADTARAAAKFGVKTVTGFTGSSVWHSIYAFPPTTQAYWDKGFADFAKRFGPILDVFEEHDINFALEVHPTEIAFDIASAQRAVGAVKGHKRFGFNYDPSHFGYQGVDYVGFLRKFHDRIFHVHMKDVAWSDRPTEAGVFGGHVDFHQPNRFWDFKSVGRGNINFEKIIRALNDIGYAGPLSVEWEDGGMDREFGAAESCAYCKRVDFPSSNIVFDAQFDKAKQA